MSFFGNGMQWFSQGVQNFAGETATIRRGAQETSVTIVRGSVTPKVMTEEGMVTLSMDIVRFLIAPQEYRFCNGKEDVMVSPQPADRLIVGEKQYMLAPVEPTKPVWYWQDQYHTFMILLTKYESEVKRS